MADTYSIDLVRAKIKTLFEQHPDVHVNVCLTHPKLNIQNVEIKIVGVYARAAYKSSKQGETGCKTVFDIAPAMLMTQDSDYIRAHML